MRSLYSGISGLQVHQTKMDVIANNIANVNTIGYKSSRVTFADFFSQTVSGASGADERSGRGGTNPMQIGLGATVASIDINMTTGVGQRTDNNFDLMIDGSGFFIVGDNSGQYFTRAGAFITDNQGNITTTSGLRLYGWDADADGNVIRDVAKPLQISGDKVYSPPNSTTDIDIVGNLDSGKTDEDVATTMSFFDSLGNSYTVDVKYTYDATSKSWMMQMGDRAYPDGDTNNPVALAYTDGTPKKLVLSPGEITTGTPATGNTALLPTVQYKDVNKIVFDNKGYVDAANSANGATADEKADGIAYINFNITSTLAPASVFGKAGSGEVKFEFTELTQFAQDDDITTDRNGYTAGNLNELNVGADGSIVATYSNGQTRVIAKIPVATFTNPAGLSKVGGSLFQQTINSGTFDLVGVDVTASGGAISAGMLEMSNVDLSREFTEMITTQRGFQANSKTISTSDEILQELVNLKR